MAALLADSSTDFTGPTPLDAKTWTRVCEYFDQLVELAPEERLSRLDALLPDAKDEVRVEVERMLRGDRTNLSLDRPAAVVPILEAAVDGQLPAGTSVGGYELIEVLGEGGMATVYLARQAKPERQVALKMRRGDPFSTSGLRRFQVETEILAGLHHPSIAQLYEAGTHWRQVAGDWVQQPFVALEYVEGARDLVTYVREEALEQGPILELFRQVCDALSYVHGHGVLHRDLKAQNLLVDQGGRPRVIDFGIAHPEAEADTRLTEEGQLLGTLANMAPEQLEGVHYTPDIRTDVYALGTVLFEALEGRPVRDLAGMSVAQSLQALRSGPLLPPSRSPRELRWIFTKAMDSDPNRRYATMGDFSEDLRRYQWGLPVLAGPPSRAYALSKWIGRHKGALVASLLIVGSLGFGLARADRARMRTVLARAETTRESNQLHRMEEFLMAMFAHAGGADATALELLEGGVARLEPTFEGSPGLRAGAESLLGKIYMGLGRSQEGGALLERAVAYERDHGDPSSTSWLRAHMNMAVVYLLEERFEEGLIVNDRLIRASENQPASAAAHRANLMVRRGLMLNGLERYAEAEQAIQAGLDLQERSGIVHTAAHLNYLGLLGHVQQAQGKHESALRVLEDVVQKRIDSGAGDDARLSDSLVNLGTAYAELERWEEAYPHLRRGVALEVKHHGEGYFNVAVARATLGEALLELGHTAEAREVFLACVDLAEQHPSDQYGAGFFQQAAIQAHCGLARLDLGEGQAQTALDRVRLACSPLPPDIDPRVVQDALQLWTELGLDLGDSAGLEEALESELSRAELEGRSGDDLRDWLAKVRG